MDIIKLSATELTAQLQIRELSAIDVLAAYQAQVEKVESDVNAFVTLDWQAAYDRTHELDQMAQPVGPLHGIPIAIKDIFETKGLRTTWGSRSYEKHTPGYDALHVARLRAAGAVIIGKSNTPEFAFSGQTTNLVSGTTRNPHDLSKTVAGSSGGAAAALAANMVALADGSDLGGSLRSPAAWCGVVGFRPSSGLVPYNPNPVPYDGLSIPGPMARNIKDLVMMLEVMQGNSSKQPLGFWKNEPSMEGLSASPRSGRLAFDLNPFGVPTDPSICVALQPVADLCKDLGWQLDQAAPDLNPLTHYVPMVRTLSALGVKAAKNPNMDIAAENFVTACHQGPEFSLSDYAEFQVARGQVWQEVAAFFEQYDFALWPTTSGLAFDADAKDHEIREDWRTVTLTPILELPSLSMPFGTSTDGLPVGLHITGPKGSDARLLQFARQIEQAAQ
ncbi:Acylamidase [Roseovarius albus]|uniref:Acylamidase n=1 Tax=Roseovarius albus TaxID=1247867 RepID=A0A1X7A707_9RHOB|nr:amidase [Roseovarius albus]SLN72260.1 Acylamidase [Roseovarius albus]